MRQPFEQKVCKFIERYSLVSCGDTLLLAVSGGADSVALLRFFLSVRETYHLHLFCVHVEHGLRGEDSRKDAVFVQKLCEDFGVPCQIVSVGEQIEEMTDTHQSLEEKARIARYAAIQTVRQEVAEEGKIVLAHHANDNAETMLFRLARGTGLMGLRAMEPMRGEYIRPFLGVSRAEIEDYLASLGQDFCTDETNADVTFSRNKIRNEIMPLFCEINPQANSHMNDTAHMLSEAADYIKQQVYFLLQEAGSSAALSVEVLKQAHPFLRKQAYLEWISHTLPGAKDVSAKQIDAIDALLEKNVGAAVYLPGQYVVRRGYETIELCRQDEMKESPDIFFETTKSELLHGSKTIIIQNYHLKFEVLAEFSMENLPRNNYAKWLDYDKIGAYISIRFARPEDYFVVDSEGHTKRINRYFIDQKIPADSRGSQLLLCDQSHVMWIVGDRMSEYYKVESSTKQILQIQFSRGEEL